MIDSNLQEQVEAAKAYDSLLVPALFGQWAVKLAQVADVNTGQRVLDVACGTGVLTQALAQRVGSSGYVAGIDPNPGMLEVGRSLATKIDWKQGVAESLPFHDDSFDVVTSQFGLMFFSDRQKALSEMLRVLAPGGRLVVAVWDSLINIPAYAKSVALLKRIAGEQAADALKAPFVLGDQYVLSQLFYRCECALCHYRNTQGSGPFSKLINNDGS